MKLLSWIVIMVIYSSLVNIYGSKYNCRVVYDRTDVTSGIQNAINSGADSIIIPYLGIDSIWNSGPLLIKNKKDLEIILEPGVVLKSKSGSFFNKYEAFITLNDCHNIKISGKNAEIRMLKDEYSDEGQWRHGISILSSDSIEILGVKISSTGGDGIYIGSGQDSVIYCSNISIHEVIADRNARNGISVISCRNLLIENCEITNTGKGNRPNNSSNGPWAGIDLEPNHEYELLENIIINNCIFRQNRGAGILFAHGAFNNDITITNNQITNNRVGISLVGRQRGNTGQMSFKNNRISGESDCGFYILNWVHNDISVNINTCTIDVQNITFPVKLIIGDKLKTPLVFGNIVFNETRFENVADLCLVYLEGIDSVNYFNGISLTNSVIINKDKSHDFLLGKGNTNSYYENKSVSGANIFCVIDKNKLVMNHIPNPVSDKFQISFNSPNQIDLMIYDSSGRLVLTKSVKNGDYVDSQNLISGKYVIVGNDSLNRRTASDIMIKM